MRRTKLKSSGKGLKRTPLKPTESPKKSGFKKKPLKNKSIELKKEASKKKHLVQKKKRNIRRKQIRKTSSNPLSREIKLCDLAFSQMIRLSNADQNGIVKCYTCSYRGFWKKDSVECGHFRGRTHMNTRWLRLNVACQCTRCNQLKSGNLEVYEKNLIRDHGPDIISYLDRESKKVTKLTVERVKNLKEYFESEVIRLKNKLAV